MESSSFKSQRSRNSEEALVLSLQLGGKPSGIQSLNRSQAEGFEFHCLKRGSFLGCAIRLKGDRDCEGD